MIRSAKKPRRTVVGWLKLVRAFHVEIARERRLILISTITVLGGVLLRLLEPWPLKFIYNAIFLGRKHGVSVAFLQRFSPEGQVAIYTVSLVVITGLAATFEYVSTVTMGVAASRILADVRGNLFRHLANLSVSFHGRNRTGDLITNVTYDVDRMREVTVSSLLPFLVNALTLTAMLGVMLWMNWKLGCIVAVVFPVFFLSVDRLMARIKEVAREQRRREGSVASATAETIGAIRTVQALSLQSRFMEIFSLANRRSLQAGNKAQQLGAGLERVIDLLATSTTALVLWFGVRNVFNGQLTPGDLIVFTNYLRTGFKPIRQLAKYLGQIARALASGDRILGLLATPLDIKDEPDAVVAPPFKGHIVFENVSFEYEPQRRALRNVSFEVKPGQKAVLTGPSGSGKSTIAGLLLRLHDPCEGRILIDGRDIRSYTLESLRSQISIVMQDSPLFALSVRDNIALGKTSSTPHEVIQAAQIANAHDFTLQMPKQYDTLLGERGATLSGGQRQRIAIARAAIRKAPIIILDEPTTGLDRKNELEVTAALDRVKGSTTLLITHDLHAAQEADSIFFLMDGGIVESGTHRNLMSLDREYAAMVQHEGLETSMRRWPVPRTSETRVWLLRHGASTFNLQHRCQGCSNEPELTAQGREEARLSAEHLASKNIHAVITSPLRRACDTVGELTKVLRGQDSKVLLKTDARLREIELYYWEGLALKEIRRRFPEQYCQWRLNPDSFHMELTDSEVRFPVRDLYDRTRSFWDYLLTVHFGKSVLLVTHGGTIRSLIATALDLGPEHFHSFQQSNCGLSRLRFPSGSRRAKLDLLNDTAHLGEHLPKLKEGRRGVRLLFISVVEVNLAAIRDLAAALDGDGIVVEHAVTVGATARDVASQLFPSSCDSCTVVSEAMATTVLEQLVQQYSQQYSEDRLRHLAILGPAEILRRILQQQLRIFDSAAECLDLHPLEITPVHLPGNGIPPVLQSMNRSKPSPALAGA